MNEFNQNILDVIGNTPIVKLNKVGNHVSSDIYVKLEYLNPGGSIKDRMGVYLCQKAVERGDLKPGGTIVESTSGNTGVGIALFAAIHGYNCVFVMADKQSQEKIDNLKAYGAKVIVCPTNVEPEDPRSYYSVAAKLGSLPNSVFLDQYGNMDNGECHFEITGPEIVLKRSRLARKVNIDQEIFLVLVQQLELAKIEELKKRPILNFIDKSDIPLSTRYPRKVLVLFSSILCGLIISSLYALVKEDDFK